MTFFKLMDSFFEEEDPTQEQIEEVFSEVPVFNSLVTKDNVKSLVVLSTLKTDKLALYKHLKRSASINAKKTYNRNPKTQIAVNNVLKCVAQEYFCSLQDAKIVMELEPEHEILELLMFNAETDDLLKDSITMLGLNK